MGLALLQRVESTNQKMFLHFQAEWRCVKCSRYVWIVLCCLTVMFSCFRGREGQPIRSFDPSPPKKDILCSPIKGLLHLDSIRWPSRSCGLTFRCWFSVFGCHSTFYFFVLVVWLAHGSEDSFDLESYLLLTFQNSWGQPPTRRRTMSVRRASELSVSKEWKRSGSPDVERNKEE